MPSRTQAASQYCNYSDRTLEPERLPATMDPVRRARGSFQASAHNRCWAFQAPQASPGAATA